MSEVVLTVTVKVTAESERDAEKLLNDWLRGAEQDERLVWYRVDNAGSYERSDAMLK